jgi:hypothetical protein
MTEAQREHRILALADLIRIHRMHLNKIGSEITTMTTQLKDRKHAQTIRRGLLAELMDEKKQLQKEESK